MTISTDCPDSGMGLDKCRCNLSQEGDRHVGEERYLTGIHDKVYSSTPTRHNHFKCIGVKLLDRNLFMCVVIVSGKK